MNFTHPMRRLGLFVLVGAALWGPPVPPAQAEQKAPERPTDKPADKPTDKLADKPAAGEGRKPPVRTYSSVTVVDNPRQAPPLPTGRKVDGAAAASRDKAPLPPRSPAPVTPQTASPLTPEPARSELRPDKRAESTAEPAERPGDLKALRRELQDLRRELRDSRDSRDPNDAARKPSPRLDAPSPKRSDRERPRLLRD